MIQISHIHQFLVITQKYANLNTMSAIILSMALKFFVRNIKIAVIFTLTVHNLSKIEKKR